MSTARWEQIKQVFSAAMEMPAGERSAFVERACGNDAELRREVESLLAARTQGVVRTGGAAEALGEATTAALVSTRLSERVGTVIGPYKLLQEIGEGGFGTVFLAEQSVPVRRKVALKIIKLGMDTRQVVARFEAERQALALMDHPHIARVLDGGATPVTESGGGAVGGRPYFVMEYVIGDAITKFADAHRLSLHDRLELFQQVCSAVQHAHTKGIIHRDLKPGNVLVSMVDGKPFAKVIDFGIAKATAQPLTEKTLFTEHKMLIGTPEYMSPEQAEGSLDIDTRTDVYALGVLLYELLTGTTPIESERLRSAAYDEMRRMIREDEPLAPSMKLSRSLDKLASTAAARNAEPGKLSALVRGELDWIVLKALEKERGRRYETPSALADDVRRHLAGEPVVAAPVSRAYRVRKFVRRNRGVVIGVSAVVLALAAGGSVAAWQWNLANTRERAQSVSLRATEALLSDMMDAGARTRPFDASGLLPESTFTQFYQQHAQDGINWSRDSSGTRRFNAGKNEQQSEDNPRRMAAVLAYAGKEALAAIQTAQRQADVATRQRDLMTSTLEDLYKPGTVIETMAQATAGGFLMGLRARDDYQSVPEEDRAVWEVAQMAKFMTRQYSAQLDAAEWSAYTANLALAQAAMEAGDYPEARKRLAEAPESKRGWEWAYASRSAASFTWQAQGNMISAMPSTSGDRAWALTMDGRVRVWSSAEGEIVFDRRIEEIPVAQLTFDRNGRVRRGSDRAESFLFDPAGMSAIAIVLDNGVEVIDTSSIADGWRSLPSRGASWRRSVHWSADGRRLIGFGGSVIYANEMQTGQPTTLVDVGHDILSLSISTDGTLAAALDSKRGVTMVDTASMTITGRIEPANVVAETSRVSPDGTRVLISGSSGFNSTPLALYESESGRTIVAQRVYGMAFYGLAPNLAISPDNSLVATASVTGFVEVFEAVTLRRLFYVPTRFTLSALSFTSDGSTLVVAGGADGDSFEGGIVAIPLKVFGMPEAAFGDHWTSLVVGRLMSSSTSEVVAGLAITTPDGTRRIVGGADKTVRFYEAKDGKPTLPPAPATAEQPEGVYREVAVFRMPVAVTNLQMTGDGTRLIIHLQDGSARVWDIRDPEERRKDLQAEWAERVPAGAYLDTLWASDTPDDKLRDAVINDAGLTPLRRLVAAEMLEERLEDDRFAAEHAFAAIEKDQTEKAAVQAAAAAADLPARVKALVVKRAAEWEYRAPEPSDAERLAEETKQRRLAEAEAALLQLENLQMGDPIPVDFSTRVFDAERTFREYLGRTHIKTVRALVLKADGPRRAILSAERYSREPASNNTSLPPVFDPRITALKLLGLAEDESPSAFETVEAQCVIATVRKRIADSPATLAAAGEVDMKADPTLKAPLTADEHRQRAREALAKARALMAPAADGTPSEWADDEDAKALLAEAEALIEGAAPSAPQGGRP